mmetsp:Transcript_6072/g.5995  ORF Transcript_6072/g.5995 Transcript_6072/m.5995 type:complete len:231 (+) Transcript_6072:73-765(+)
MPSSMLKISTLVALASYISTTLAAPPACLLACVAQVEKKSDCTGLNDLSCICSSNGSDVKKCLDSVCPDGDADSAKSAFEDSCEGHSSSSSSSSSASSSSKASSKASSSAAASSSDSSSSSAASSAAASSSVAAASTTKGSEASSGPTQASSQAVSGETSAATTQASSQAAGGSGSDEESTSLAGVATTVSSSSTGSSAPVIPTQSEDGANAAGFSVGALLAGLAGAALL